MSESIFSIGGKAVLSRAPKTVTGGGGMSSFHGLRDGKLYKRGIGPKRGGRETRRGLVLRRGDPIKKGAKWEGFVEGRGKPGFLTGDYYDFWRGGMGLGGRGKVLFTPKEATQHKRYMEVKLGGRKFLKREIGRRNENGGKKKIKREGSKEPEGEAPRTSREQKVWNSSFENRGSLFQRIWANVRGGNVIKILLRKRELKKSQRLERFLPRRWGTQYLRHQKGGLPYWGTGILT